MVAFTLFPVWGQWNFFALSLLLAILCPRRLPFSLPKLLIQLFEFFGTGSKSFLAGTPLFLLSASAGPLDSL